MPTDETTNYEPYRVGGHWGVTIVHDPNPGNSAHGEKTGELRAMALKPEWAQQIVDALNAQHGGPAGHLPHPHGGPDPAARDAEIAKLRRRSDLQFSDRRFLLWLHAEAVWKLEEAWHDLDGWEQLADDQAGTTVVHENEKLHAERGALWEQKDRLRSTLVDLPKKIHRALHVALSCCDPYTGECDNKQVLTLLRSEGIPSTEMDLLNTEWEPMVLDDQGLGPGRGDVTQPEFDT